MGAFNTVVVAWKNPATGQELELLVQFKYGDTWQHAYRLGDNVRWGGNDIGRRGAARVVVDGALEGKPPVAGIPEDFEVYIIDNRIEAVLPASGTYDFVREGESYIVLKE
jgi:hypothetical protein